MYLGLNVPRPHRSVWASSISLGLIDQSGLHQSVWALSVSLGLIGQSGPHRSVWPSTVSSGRQQCRLAVKSVVIVTDSSLHVDIAEIRPYLP